MRVSLPKKGGEGRGRGILDVVLWPLMMLLSFTQLVAAEDMLFSRSMVKCMEDSQLSARLFKLVFTPSNNTAHVSLRGISTAEGYILVKIAISAYGIEAFTQTIDPCDNDWNQFCPMNYKKNLEWDFNLSVDEETAKQIPGVAYTIPDLDGTARITVHNRETGEMLACAEAPISNGRTVEHKAAGWTTAIVAGLGIVTSLLLVASGKARSQAAAHVATYALAFFSYMQAQALVGLTAVSLPPLPQAWTQNFQWSMGIMRVGWMQRVFTWYIRATGGSTSNILYSASRISVNIQKRSLDLVKRADIVRRAIQKRSISESDGILKLRGVDRVAYKAKIETTNIFITGLVYFILLLIFGALVTTAFKYIADLLAKRAIIRPEKFLRFRTKWKKILKGVLYQICLLGYPSVSVLSLYEFTVRDSPAAVVLAVFYLLAMTGILAWATFWILKTTSFNMMSPSTIELEKASPITAANRRKSKASRWGMLCVTFDKNHYYFIAPLLIYILLKSIFIGVAQNSPETQAVALFVIELIYLSGVCYIRPWMDKRTNICNISIAVVNMLNATCLMIFSGIFNAPRIAMGIVGVIFFILNALFSFILLVLVLASTIKVIVHRNQATPNNSARSSMMSQLPNLAAENTPLSPNSTETANSTDKPVVETQVYRGLSSRASNTLSKRSSDALRREISRSSIATSARTGISRRERPPMPSTLSGENQIPLGAGNPYYTPANTPPPPHFHPLEPGRSTPVERATSRASNQQGYPFPQTPAPVEEQPENMYEDGYHHHHAGDSQRGRGY